MHKNDVCRGTSVDQDNADIHLQKGQNCLLIKVTQAEGDFKDSQELNQLRPHIRTDYRISIIVGGKPLKLCLKLNDLL